MTIRIRLLRDALLITLIPLVAVVAFTQAVMLRVDEKVGAVAYESLLGNARDYLRTMVEDYSRLGDLSKRNVESLLRWQASEVETRLAGAQPTEGNINLSRAYDAGEAPVEITKLRKYMRHGNDDRWTPIGVNFHQQVYVPAPESNLAALRPDMLRLADMPGVYQRLYNMNPPLIQWQYTALQSGFLSCYPGHGGYPASYDPRVRPWYTDARNADTLVWTLLPVVSSRSVSMTASMPVRWPDGSFAGVTAIDVPIDGMLRELKLPHEWAEKAETFHVMATARDDGGEPDLVVIIRRRYETLGREWDKPLELDVLQSRDTVGLAALRADAMAGRSGVRRMPLGGVDSIWAWSPYDQGQLISVVIVPYDVIIADAQTARGIIGRSTHRALLYSGGVFFVAILAVTCLAIRRSRQFTQPIRQLAGAATQLADGRFDMHVDIDTKDELENLGGLVNAIGPQLAERERMQRSLMLARDIQSHLLPHKAPALEGFDIAGSSNYCDETGGDYFDYVPLPDTPGALGIAVGDITGHGIAAALLMASARAVLRSHAVHEHGDLGHMFSDINSHLVTDTDDSRFLTLFYGVLDGLSAKLRWVSGGHDPALWFRAENADICELDDGSGLLLGAFDGVDYQQSKPIVLAPGDVVLIGTDGIWEALNDRGEEFGKPRLKDILRQHADRSAEQIVAAVQQAVTAFRGPTPQLDDITAVVIKRTT